ncbi:MAG TPA: PEP-CTERM sorting domain-containing protein, partial [Nitrospirales bacterium]
QGFLESGGIFTPINVPGASSTLAHGINDAGQIVGGYNVGSGYHGFLYSGGSFTPIDVPGASSTQANGINDAGQIVGSFDDVIGGIHGFLATPVSSSIPEPSTWLLLGSGLIGLVLWSKKRPASKTPFTYTSSAAASSGRRHQNFLGTRERIDVPTYGDPVGDTTFSISARILTGNPRELYPYLFHHQITHPMRRRGTMMRMTARITVASSITCM